MPTVVQVHGFNEAAAYRRGIRGVHSVGRAESVCFNEAAAYRRGIRSATVMVWSNTSASMRPRHIAAEYGDVGRHGLTAGQASMRPRHIAAEYGLDVEAAHAVDLASMRPRHIAAEYGLDLESAQKAKELQ